jgi:ubiquitin
MDNPDKLTTQGTQEEENQNKNTPQCVLDTKLFLFSSAKQL